jgi:hypothetical protein
VPCPAHAKGEPNCLCDIGFFGKLRWNFTAQAWGGECSSVRCPDNSRPVPGKNKCECDDRYHGSIVWGGTSWVGVCHPAPCPPLSYGTPNKCACESPFVGTISWSKVTRWWVGSCQDPACPKNAHGVSFLSRYPPTSDSVAGCTCRAGFQGPLAFNSTSSKWEGSCNAVPCPPGSAIAPSSNSLLCSCSEGYSGSLTFNNITRSYTGQCTLKECPVVLDFSGGTRKNFVSIAPDCQCPAAGYASSLKWISAGAAIGTKSTVGEWSGHCDISFCPNGAFFDENEMCRCHVGYSGEVKWSNTPPRWEGICDPAVLPANSQYLPGSVLKASCLPGFTGELTWDSATSAWTGACTVVPCPPDSKGEGLKCVCGELFEQDIVFDLDRRMWTGSCVPAKTIFPDPSRVFVVTIFQIILASCCALLLLSGAIYRYTKWFKCLRPKEKIYLNRAPLQVQPAATPSNNSRDSPRSRGAVEMQSINRDRNGDVVQPAVGEPPTPPIPLDATNAHWFHQAEGQRNLQEPLTGGTSLEMQGRESRSGGAVMAASDDKPQPSIAAKKYTAEQAPISPSEATRGKKSEGSGGGTKLNALGAARFVASIHVVAGHLLNRVPSIGYAWATSAWGFTW